MIHALHHQTDELLAYLDNKGDKLFWDDLHVHEIQGENTFKFTMPSDIQETEFFDERSRFLIPSEDGGFEEFIVFESETTIENEKRVYGVATYSDMNTQSFVNPNRFDSLTVKEYADLILPNTEWDIGTVEFHGTRTITLDKHEGAYYFLVRVAKAFEIDMRFRIETSGNRIVGRYVDFIKSVGLDNKKEIVLGKDLVEMDKKVHSERIVTALFCVGPEKEDGKKLTVMITDEDAFQRWNRKGKHITAIYEPQSENQDMTIEQLEQYGRTELNKRIASVVDYKITAASLETIFPHEKVRLGDKLRVKNPDFSPPLYAEARAIRIERSISDSSSKKYIVGEVVTFDESERLSDFRDFQQMYGISQKVGGLIIEGQDNTLPFSLDIGGKTHLSDTESEFLSLSRLDNGSEISSEKSMIKLMNTSEQVRFRDKLDTKYINVVAGNLNLYDDHNDLIMFIRPLNHIPHVGIVTGKSMIKFRQTDRVIEFKDNSDTGFVGIRAASYLSVTGSKENTKNIDDIGLSDIGSLLAVEFDELNEEDEVIGRKIGLESSGGSKSLDTDPIDLIRLTTMLVKSIQELHTLVEELKTTNTDLLTRIEALEKQ